MRVEVGLVGKKVASRGQVGLVKICFLWFVNIILIVISLFEPVPSFLFSRLLCFLLRCFFWETSGDELVVWPPELKPSSDVDSICPFSVIELILSDRWYFWIMVKKGSYTSPKVCFCLEGGTMEQFENAKTNLWSKSQMLENFKFQSDRSKFVLVLKSTRFKIQTKRANQN